MTSKCLMSPTLCPHCIGLSHDCVETVANSCKQTAGQQTEAKLLQLHWKSRKWKERRKSFVKLPSHIVFLVTQSLLNSRKKTLLVLTLVLALLIAAKRRYMLPPAVPAQVAQAMLLELAGSWDRRWQGITTFTLHDNYGYDKDANTDDNQQLVSSYPNQHSGWSSCQTKSAAQ